MQTYLLDFRALIYDADKEREKNEYEYMKKKDRLCVCRYVLKFEKLKLKICIRN